MGGRGLVPVVWGKESCLFYNGAHDYRLWEEFAVAAVGPTIPPSFIYVFSGWFAIRWEAGLRATGSSLIQIAEQGKES